MTFFLKKRINKHKNNSDNHFGNFQAGRINALVLVHAETVKPITTPPYDDGVSEAEMIALYKQKFSEIYP